jgi:beta-glucuronidase
MPLRPALLALLVLATAASAQDGHADLVQNAHARDHVVLDGTWSAIVDPFDVGSRNIFDEPIPDRGFNQDARPQHRSDLIEYSFDDDGTLRVPGDWNSQRDRLFFYEGTVWYRRPFTVARAPGERLVLRFGAANHRARVFLDGELVGEHEGGYTPFDVEITDRVPPTSAPLALGELAETEHTLVVEVGNRRERTAVPTDNMDWWNYGGLTRSVRLLRLPATYVRDYTLALDPGGETVSGWAALDGPDLDQSVTVSVPALGVSETVQTDAGGVARFSFPFRGERWSPEAPRLYDVVVASESDRVEDRVGFRTVAVDGFDVLLNGEPVFLRGISIHEEAPFRGGRGLTEAENRQLLQWALDLGCNYVRLAHYPHDEAMLRLADEMGLLVWAEVPVYWSIAWDDPGTYASAERQLRELVTRDKNRASVVLWSVANETPISPARTDFLVRLVEAARALDPTRLVTAAVFAEITGAPDGGTLFTVEDPLAEHLDVVGVNEYVGWYGSLPDAIPGTRWATTVEKPLVISEFGAGALYGLRGDSLTRWTEDYQAHLYREQVAMLRRIPFLRGMSPWILTDFRSPRRPLPRIQDWWNRKGLLSDRGERKAAFGVLRAFYDEVEADWRPSPTGF